MEVVEIGLSGIKWFKWIFITGSPRIHIISDGVASDLLEIHFKMHLILCQHSNVPHANKKWSIFHRSRMYFSKIIYKELINRKNLDAF